MAQASAPKKRQYSLLRAPAPILLLESCHQVPADVDRTYASVLLAAPPQVRAIARACREAAASLGFAYGPFDLYTLARLQEDDAFNAINNYRLVAALAKVNP